MANMPNSTEGNDSYLIDAKSNLGPYLLELKKELNPIVYDGLRNWIKHWTTVVSSSIKGVCKTRNDQLSILAQYQQQGIDKIEGQSSTKLYFELINPGPIVSELRDACSIIEELVSGYHAFMCSLKKDSFVGPVVGRYHLPNEVIRGILESSLSPIDRPIKNLMHLRDGILNHKDVLRSVSKARLLKKGVQVATSATTRSFGIPFGGLAAKAILGIFMDTESPPYKSLQKVSRMYTEFCDSLDESNESIMLTTLYALASIYGGLLIRTEDDLNSVGRTIVGIDFECGKISIGLTDSAKQEYRKWARGSYKVIRRFKKKRDIVSLINASEAAISMSLQDCLLAQVHGRSRSVSCVVDFSSLRAIALNMEADSLWNCGQWDEACMLYGRLISGVSISCEKHQYRLWRSRHEFLYLAGLRLAIHATMLNEALKLDYLFVLPRFVAYTLTRLAHGSWDTSALGENLSDATIISGVTIYNYAKHRQFDVGLEDTIDRASVEIMEELYKETLESRNADCRFVLSLIGSKSLKSISSDSDFVNWMNEQALYKRLQGNINLN